MVTKALYVMGVRVGELRTFKKEIIIKLKPIYAMAVYVAD
jgi:hypothetical protein